MNKEKKETAARSSAAAGCSRVQALMQLATTLSFGSRYRPVTMPKQPW